MHLVANDRDALVALNDRRLQRLLRAEERDAERELERVIVEEARPIVAGIVSRYTRTGTLLTADDADDVIATVNLRLVEKLRAVSRGPDEAIQNLQSYVATLAYNSVNDLLRKRFPERARLKKRVRYALTTDTRLALWMTLAGPAGGLREWEGREDALEEMPPVRAAAGHEDHEVLPELFRTVGRPVLVDALVDVVAELWSVSDSPAEPELAHLPALAPAADARVEASDFARALWEEIRRLRPPQRKALLLNLRYNGELDVISVLMLSGIARFSDIAAALEMTETELAAIWKELPLDDLHIAGLLQVTRQQVINLRKAARNRLSRRLPR